MGDEADAGDAVGLSGAGPACFYLLRVGRPGVDGCLSEEVSDRHFYAWCVWRGFLFYFGGEAWLGKPWAERSGFVRFQTGTAVGPGGIHRPLSFPVLPPWRANRLAVWPAGKA